QCESVLTRKAMPEVEEVQQLPKECPDCGVKVNIRRGKFIMQKKYKMLMLLAILITFVWGGIIIWTGLWLMHDTEWGGPRQCHLGSDGSDSLDAWQHPGRQSLPGSQNQSNHMSPMRRRTQVYPVEG
ncbi:hypothetical protein ACFL4W_05165, partial [Planctomycetota bacterium]